MPEAKRLDEQQVRGVLLRLLLKVCRYAACTSSQVLRAVQALQAHVTDVERRQKPQLLTEDPFIFAVVALKRAGGVGVVKRWPYRM